MSALAGMPLSILQNDWLWKFAGLVLEKPGFLWQCGTGLELTVWTAAATPCLYKQVVICQLVKSSSLTDVFIEISFWGGWEHLKVTVIFILLQSGLGFAGLGVFENILESIFPFKFHINISNANKSSLYYLESTEVSVKYNLCQRTGFYTKWNLLLLFPFAIV